MLSKAIKDQRIKYLPVDKDQYTRIVIRRKHLWDDAMNHVKPAVDKGRPLREFFHLLTAEMARRNMIFCGEEYSRILRHCMLELENCTWVIPCEINTGKIFNFQFFGKFAHQ